MRVNEERRKEGRGERENKRRHTRGERIKDGTREGGEGTW